MLIQITCIRKLNLPYSKISNTSREQANSFSSLQNQLNVKYECFGTKFNYINLRNFKD